MLTSVALRGILCKVAHSVTFHFIVLFLVHNLFCHFYHIILFKAAYVKFRLLSMTASQTSDSILCECKDEHQKNKKHFSIVRNVLNKLYRTSCTYLLMVCFNFVRMCNENTIKINLNLLKNQL